MKNFILTTLFTVMVFALPADVQAGGPFENLLDCATECISKYDAWTLRLTACAADCYVQFVREIFEVLSTVIEALK